MENILAESGGEADSLRGAAERSHPADARVRADRPALPHLIESRAVGGSAVVAVIGTRVRGCVLETRIRAEPSVRREGIVGTIDRGCETERRELLVAAQRFQRRLIAHAEIDAEVHVARIDLADLEPVVQAR